MTPHDVGPRLCTCLLALATLAANMSLTGEAHAEPMDRASSQAAADSALASIKARSQDQPDAPQPRDLPASRQKLTSAQRDAVLLSNAIGSQDVALIERLMARGLSPNAAIRFHLKDNTTELTPLMLAISSKAGLAVIQTLVAAGANVNQSAEGLLPLNFALSLGQYAQAQYLLEQGALPNGVDGIAGMTPLIDMAASARSKRQDDVIQMAWQLLRAGADVNIKARRSSTALMFAVLSEHLELVSLLLDAGADASVANDRGETALALARKKGLQQIEALLTAPP